MKYEFDIKDGGKRAYEKRWHVTGGSCEDVGPRESVEVPIMDRVRYGPTVLMCAIG